MKDPCSVGGFASRFIELGTRLAQAPGGRCSFCTQSFDASRSTAKIARCFCSQRCEQAYIRQNLNSMSLSHCNQILERLEALLRSSRRHEPV